MFRSYTIFLLLAVGLVWQCTAKINKATKFNPQRDAQDLRKFVSATDKADNVLLDILTNRTREQRAEIQSAYETRYNKTLINDLKDVVFGNFYTLLHSLLLPLPEYFARLLKDVGRQSELVADLVIDASNAELKSISETYSNLFPKSVPLVTHLVRLRQPVTHNMIRKAFAGARSRDEGAHYAEVAKDASTLLIGSAAQVEDIFVTRSYKQLAYLFTLFEETTRIYIEDAFLDRDFHEDLISGLLLHIKYVKDKHKYFADRVYEAMYVTGINDAMLIRIFTSHSEKELHRISKSFEDTYGHSLVSCVNEDTSNDYSSALMAIIEE